jgi:hypothetical protein
VYDYNHTKMQKNDLGDQDVGEVAASLTQHINNKQNKSLNTFELYPIIINAYQSNQFKKFPSSTMVISQDFLKADGSISKRFMCMPFSNQTVKKIIKHNYHLFEVLPDSLPRKFYIDIDIKKTDPSFGLKTYTEIHQIVISFMQTFMQTNCQSTFDTKHAQCLVVHNSAEKQSLHFIFPIYLKNVSDTKCFAHVLSHFIQSSANVFMMEVLDFSVYNSNQNFRLPFQSKVGKDDLILEPLHTKSIKSPIDYIVGISYNVERC